MDVFEEHYSSQQHCFKGRQIEALYIESGAPIFCVRPAIEEFSAPSFWTWVIFKSFYLHMCGETEDPKRLCIFYTWETNLKQTLWTLPENEIDS